MSWDTAFSPFDFGEYFLTTITSGLILARIYYFARAILPSDDVNISDDRKEGHVFPKATNEDEFEMQKSISEPQMHRSQFSLKQKSDSRFLGSR